MSALSGAAGPALYSCPSVTADTDLNPVGMTRKKLREITPANTLIQNICPGHNQVLNDALLKIVQKPRDVSQIYVYDLWIANLAVLYGKICFDNTPHTLYRQHGTNELGSKGTRFGKLVKAGRRAFGGEGGKNKRQMAYFARLHREELAEQGLYDSVRELLEADSFGKRLRFTVHCPFYRQSRVETLAFKTAVLFGKY